MKTEHTSEQADTKICRVGGGFVIFSGSDPKDDHWLHTYRGDKGETIMISGPVKVYPEIDLTCLMPVNKSVPIPEEQWKGCNEDLPSLPLWRKTRYAKVELKDQDTLIFFDCEIGEQVDPSSKEVRKLARKMIVRCLQKIGC